MIDFVHYDLIALREEMDRLIQLKANKPIFRRVLTVTKHDVQSMLRTLNSIYVPIVCMDIMELVWQMDEMGEE